MLKQFEVFDTAFPEAKLIQSFQATDERGGFVKDYSRKLLKSAGIEYDIKEVFYTYSHTGVIRAIHFQLQKLQPKLVRAVSGQIYDVIVDLRKNSSTFGMWEGFMLTQENCREIFVPAGFGHGYLVLQDAIVSYKCAEDFYGEYDSGIRWDDADLNISWPLEKLQEEIILSEKDKALMSLQQFKEIHKGL